MKKVLNKQNKQNKQTKTDEEEDKEEDKEKQKKIPESVIFHPYHIRQIGKSGIIERLKAKQAKQLRYHIKIKI